MPPLAARRCQVSPMPCLMLHAYAPLRLTFFTLRRHARFRCCRSTMFATCYDGHFDAELFAAFSLLRFSRHYFAAFHSLSLSIAAISRVTPTCFCSRCRLRYDAAADAMRDSQFTPPAFADVFFFIDCMLLMMPNIFRLLSRCHADYFS